jgi:apolipoprotein N-acyltransferase
MPFIHTIPLLEQLAITLDENSITGSLGVSDSAYSLGYGEPVAPIICYESIYGDYVRSYVKKGATWLGIITNDAWWENTPGYHQHYSYAKLRAIEFRKWVARSANTGTSGFIDPVGNSYDETSWYAKTCIQRTISANNIKTLYLYLGDIGVLAIYSLMVLVFYLWKRPS